MKQIIYRKNNLFIIDKDQLLDKPGKEETVLALYSAIYKEYLGAVEQDKYKSMTSVERFNSINEFANNWLKSRGFI